MAERKSENMFLKFIEKHVFSKLPNYKLRMKEIDEIVSKNKQYTNSFIEREPYYRDKVSEKETVLSLLSQYYKNELMFDDEFRKLLYKTMKESETFIQYKEGVYEHALDKLISDFNLKFMKDLGVNTELTTKRELKHHTHVIGDKSYLLSSVDNIEEFRVSFEPKMLVVKKIT